MPSLAALTSLLLLLPGFVVAQVYAPDCQASSLASWRWTFNSLNQNPCAVVSYLMSTCNKGSFTINPLPAPGYVYSGPTEAFDDGNMCKCNTISYSLISACDACQGSSWTSWTEYSVNCTKPLPPSTFPNPVPAGTRVPQWALLDVTVQNNWNANQSYIAGDAPEVGPGGALGPSSVSTATRATGTTTRSTSAGNSPSATPGASSNGGSSSSNAGAIAGGVVGGITAVSIAGVAVFYLRQRRLKTASTPLTTQFQMDQVPQPLPLSDNGTFAPSSDPESPMALMKLYDPSDPTTFPGHQGVRPDIPASVPLSPHSGSGNTLATMHTSWPPGYHGLPTV
ncbi:hypothetical protein BJV74DRAFT_867515 [Russula compacta]|nr:hypothetical protein BJV74DRAFT_867515 [Russula compacta]